MTELLRRTEKPVIVVDCDDTEGWTAEQFTGVINHEFGTQLTASQWNEDVPQLLESINVSLDERQTEEFLQLLFATQLSGQIKPNEEAMQMVEEYGDDMHFMTLTSRRNDKAMMDATHKWVDLYFPKMAGRTESTGIFRKNAPVSAYTRTKGPKCEELGAALLIDDLPKHNNAVARLGMGAVLLDSFGKVEQSQVESGVHHVQSWMQIGPILEATLEQSRIIR